MKRLPFLAALGALPLASGLANAGEMSPLSALSAATHWLGDKPRLAALSGRVVLVDVFTFDCINCSNITPNLKRLSAMYSRTDLEIIGVHTPEVPAYQRSIAYVASHRDADRISWPVAIDNDARIWDTFGVSAWPTQLIFDRRGRLRATIVGDSKDQLVDAAIARLVKA